MGQCLSRASHKAMVTHPHLLSSEEELRVVALYDYDEDISFRKNDILFVTRPLKDWWSATHERTGEKGVFSDFIFLNRWP